MLYIWKAESEDSNLIESQFSTSYEASEFVTHPDRLVTLIRFFASPNIYNMHSWKDSPPITLSVGPPLDASNTGLTAMGTWGRGVHYKRL